MATTMAATFSVPLGCWFAGQTEISQALISAAILFLSQCVFMPKLIQRDMKVDADAAIEEFEKNKLVNKVF